MITLNCGFSRTVRAANRYRRQWRNVVGIELELQWDDGDHRAIREALMGFAPPGKGWRLEGYCLIRPAH